MVGWKVCKSEVKGTRAYQSVRADVSTLVTHIRDYNQHTSNYLMNDESIFP